MPLICCRWVSGYCTEGKEKREKQKYSPSNLHCDCPAFIVVPTSYATADEASRPDIVWERTLAAISMASSGSPDFVLRLVLRNVLNEYKK